MALLAEAITDNPTAVAVLKERGILASDGSWRVTNVAAKNLGTGPILDPAVVERFAECDRTRSFKVLRWMLLQAGGGTKRLETSKQVLEEIKTDFIRRRMEGIGEREAKITPMTQEEAATAWAAEEEVFKWAYLCADLDTLMDSHYTVFGYDRMWPGVDDIYEKVFKAVSTFNMNMASRDGRQTKISIINKAREARALESNTVWTPVNTGASSYESLEDLERVNTEFFNTYQRRKEIKNVQFIGKEPASKPGGTPIYKKSGDAKLYEDDNLVVFIPATAAAMMKVGWQGYMPGMRNAWCVANRTEFDRAFANQNPAPPRWTGYSQRGPLAVVWLKDKNIFEPDRPEGHEHHKSIQQFAVYLNSAEGCDIGNLVEPYEGVQFFDRENRNSPTIVNWAELLGRLERIGNPSLVQSVRTAMKEIADWARQMQPGDIKMSVYEYLARVQVQNILES